MKEAEKIYNKIATVYDKMRAKGKRFNDLLEMPAVFSMLKSIKGKKILDAGCGSGIYCKILAKKGAKVQGLDVSSKMLDIAKEKCKNLDVKLKKGSITKLPYKSGTFDIVIASLVIHYLKNPDKALNEFYRVLKKGGFLIFSTGHPVVSTFEKFIKYKGKYAMVLADYFKKGKYYWKILYAPKVKIPSYHFTFEQLLKLIMQSKFKLDDFKETRFLSKHKKNMLPPHKKFMNKPTFVVFKLKKE